MITYSPLVGGYVSVLPSSIQSSLNNIGSTSQLGNHNYPDLTGRVVRREHYFPAHTGGFSDVYTGFLVEDPSKEVAIKVLRIVDKTEETEKIRKYLIREASVWHKLKHRNVLRFLGLVNGLGRLEACPALVSPYCSNGTSGDYVRRLNPPVEARINLILEVAWGLEYLHREGIVHGDLKPSNVLIGDNDEALLSDFGRASIFDLHGFKIKPGGAVRYQAPELLGSEMNPNTSSDVCAFGLTAFELWTGLLPYGEIRNDNVVIRNIILHKAQPRLPDPPPAMADLLWPILTPCMSHRPEDRPSISTVVQQLEFCTQVPFR